MRALHFDCFSGISGDMTLAALIDLGVDMEAIRAGLDSLGLPIRLEVHQVRKGGFAAKFVEIEAPEQQTHRFLPDIEAIIDRGALTTRQRELAHSIFRRLAEAEAAVHGLPLEKVHFHEVGALDSIADIVGAAIGLDLLGAEYFTSRSVVTGHGTVRCAHGIMPIPTPATAYLLRGVPLAACDIKAELTTPTGAAILVSVVRQWVEHPVMTVERIGHGAGRREFDEQPNLLRLFLGEITDAPPAGLTVDRVWLLETNLDDVPGEIVGYCVDRLFAAGALDVYTIPTHMKKNRPGILLNVLAAPDHVERLEEIVFRETATLGIRRTLVLRHKLHREPIDLPTPWGNVKGKLAWRGDTARAAHTITPEYEDCARIARENAIPLRDVYAKALESARQLLAENS
jgi:uncharacterized protein (TIGR00299 family) protein